MGFSDLQVVGTHEGSRSRKLDAGSPEIATYSLALLYNTALLPTVSRTLLQQLAIKQALQTWPTGQIDEGNFSVVVFSSQVSQFNNQVSLPI